MNPIIPTIFAHNKKQFNNRLKKLVPVSNKLQVDFMDGKFVPAKSIQLSSIPSLKKYKKTFEAHMMSIYPQKRIPKLSRLGFKKFIFHISAVNSPEQVIERARKWKLSPWIALNPETKIETVIPFLLRVDGVMLMGVSPGKEHQQFLRKVYKKIKLLKKVSPKTKIQIDGGANPKTIRKLAKIGVDYVNSGSYISESEYPKEEYKKLNEIFRNNKK
jgi:ribulose-phosphate 3-epimerase